jgi:hypothetical protein
MARLHTDLSIVQVSVAPDTATAGTTLGVTDANAALLPSVYPWWAAIKPTGVAPTRANAEIVKVTAGSSAAGTTTYTIVRAQGVPATTARSVGVGDDIYEAVSTNGSLNINALPDSDHEASGTIVTLTANENQAFGDVCFINADGEAALGDADAIASAMICVMCADATISANATGRYLLYGFARDDSWAWTAGGYIYLTVTGTTGNTLSQTAPTGTDDCVVMVGYATNADRMLFGGGWQSVIERT